MACCAHAALLQFTHTVSCTVTWCPFVVLSLSLSVLTSTNRASTCEQRQLAKSVLGSSTKLTETKSLKQQKKLVGQCGMPCHPTHCHSTSASLALPLHMPHSPQPLCTAVPFTTPRTPLPRFLGWLAHTPQRASKLMAVAKTHTLAEEEDASEQNFFHSSFPTSNRKGIGPGLAGGDPVLNKLNKYKMAPKACILTGNCVEVC